MSNTRKGGNPPLGYQWHCGELVVVSDEAAIVRELFDLFLIHQRKRTVAKLLNERGYRTRVGKHFQYSTVSRILQNPVMKGVLRYSTTEKGTGKHIQHESIVESIVPEELWDQVAAILTDQSGTQTRIPAQDIFVGKVLCGCGDEMEILSKSSAYSCGQCNTHIEIDDVHAIFEDNISDIPFPDFQLLQSLLSKNDPDSRSSIQSRINSVSLGIDKLYELYTSTAITAEEFKKRHTPMKIQLDELNHTLENLENHTTYSHNTLHEYWSSLERNTKRNVVETVVHHITIQSNVASLSLYPLFNFAQLGSISR